jgi:hypothetical protein
MPQCQFLFSAAFVFQKSYTGNILGIRQNESQSSYFTDTKTGSKAETEEGQGLATPEGGTPWPCHRMVRAPWVPSDIALPPMYS